MPFVDIPLNNYTYRFRKLTYVEEFGLGVTGDVALRRATLRKALVGVSGLEIQSPEDAAPIIEALPDPVIYRVWMLYQNGLPEEQFFSTRGLYRAPDPNEIIIRSAEADDRREQVVDKALNALESKFGRTELREEQEHQRMLVANARKRGILVAASVAEVEEDG
jgi:hypothetical protein